MMIMLMTVMALTAVTVMAVNILAVMKSAGHTVKYVADINLMMMNQ